METIVYIDGYNLYYGCLKHSNYRWLDVRKLFAETIVKIQSRTFTVTKIKYFTADVKTKFSSHGVQAQAAQSQYHRALKHLYPNEIEIIKGYYSEARAVLPRYKTPPDLNDLAHVWRLEEKQTDVNIALHAFRDVVSRNCEQIVIVSNDTDLEPLLKMVREEVGSTISVGVIFPIIKLKSDGAKERPPSASLSQYADWTRRHILEEELEASQLSDVIPTNKKPIRKPSYW
ncbi:MAG: NYN domain-containing protein [Mariprofundaceae bacterium]